MRRTLLVLTASLVMAAMLMASALPALAQGPPTIPPGAAHAVPNVIEHNPAITIVKQNPPCVLLSTPGPGRGHHSDFPDGCSGLVQE